MVAGGCNVSLVCDNQGTWWLALRCDMSVETHKTQQSAARIRQLDSWVYFDGEFLRYRDLGLGLMTHALHYGTGVFEGIRAYWNAEQRQLRLLQAAAHFDRLRRSARILKIELRYSTEELISVSAELLRRNGYQEDTYVRPIAFTSSEEIGVRLHNIEHSLGIYTSPFGNYVDVDSGIRCHVTAWRRIDDNAAPARAKITGTYINGALAKSDAIDAGYDEAIVLTSDGHVSEGSAENLFIIRDGTLITPPVSDNILEGITRRLVIELARDEGFGVVERQIDRTELYICDELFLCGTGAQISPVVEVDGRKIGGGGIGAVTARLQHIYFPAVHGDLAKYHHWSMVV